MQIVSNCSDMRVPGHVADPVAHPGTPFTGPKSGISLTHLFLNCYNKESKSPKDTLLSQLETPLSY